MGSAPSRAEPAKPAKALLALDGVAPDASKSESTARPLSVSPPTEGLDVDRRITMDGSKHGSLDGSKHGSGSPAMRRASLTRMSTSDLHHHDTTVRKPTRHSAVVRVNPFTKSSDGLKVDVPSVLAAMNKSEFFASARSANVQQLLAPHFALCAFAMPTKKAPILRKGEDMSFAGVITSGALIVTKDSATSKDATPLYSLTRDDTIGESLVAVSRRNFW